MFENLTQSDHPYVWKFNSIRPHIVEIWITQRYVLITLFKQQKISHDSLAIIILNIDLLFLWICNFNHNVHMKEHTK